MKNVKCTHCKYSWETETEKEFVTCPSCQRKTKVGDRTINENKVKRIKA